MLFVRRFLADLAKLRLPVTAAAVVGTAVAVLSPFGLDVGPDGAKITGALVAVGAVAAYLQHLIR